MHADANFDRNLESCPFYKAHDSADLHVIGETRAIYKYFVALLHFFKTFFTDFQWKTFQVWTSFLDEQEACQKYMYITLIYVNSIYFEKSIE